MKTKLIALRTFLLNLLSKKVEQPIEPVKEKKAPSGKRNYAAMNAEMFNKHFAKNKQPKED